MAQKNKVDVYDIVTEHIIAEMEKGIIPWQQPWCGGSDEAISYTSRKPYSLLNQMLLGKPGEYLTYKQAVALGGQVKKGAKGKMVVFYTMVNQKKVKEEYYSTLYHELTHSTGISKRCNRKIDGVAAFGDMSYAKEELVAEIGSAMTLNRLGIDCEKAFKNSVGYLQGWLKVLRDDKKMIVIAAGQAQKAVDYIFGKTPAQE